MEKFVINKNANGEFQFNFIDKNGLAILTSYPYTRKFMCEKGIESVRRNSQVCKRFYSKTTLNSEPYFNLKAFNGKIIGKSQVFEDSVSRDNGIESLKRKAPVAPVEDQSKY